MSKKYPSTEYAIYYAVDSRKGTKKEPFVGPRLLHRMSCNDRPLARHQACAGSHVHIADALKEAQAKYPDWEIEICGQCQEKEDSRVSA